MLPERMGKKEMIWHGVSTLYMSGGLMVTDTVADHMELTPQCRRQKTRKPRLPPVIPWFNQWNEGGEKENTGGTASLLRKVFEEQSSESGS